uniref:BMERB domain-containing protein n=2 Tax=Dendroctonus ponderosae TaxID=77166 RepID=A0AAR5PP91_DENPD
MRPDVLYKKENIKKERDVNKKLIEEMVMNKMKAENKSLERKKRNRSNLSSLSPSMPKPTPTDIVSQINRSNLSKTSNSYATPDLLSDSIPPVDSSNDVFSTPMASFTPKSGSNRPLSVFSTFTDVRTLPATPLTNPENFSMPDIRKNLFGDDFKTPKAPPRFNRPSDLVKTAEKMKETARARARLLSNEDLGLSPEEKISKLREKAIRKPHKDVHVQESIESLVLNTERRNSLLYSNDTLSKKRNNSFKRSKSGDADAAKAVEKGLSARPKSISEIPKNLSVSKSAEREQEESKKKICMSDPNLLDTSASKSKKKSKDRERRKSITKLIAGIFSKKSPSGTGSKGLFAKLSPKSKEKSKSLTSLDLCKHETAIEEAKPRKSFSELNIKRREPTPPPIPPLPANYTMKATDESSDGEVVESKMQDRSSCDTVDQSGNADASTAGKKSGKARRVSRQAQLKRHRMAQEIQRKLEETEVKTRELEQRGVEIEKALRGEDGGVNVKDESDLLQEWFDLMRDRTELRRYEKELMVRAQEVELEDRHSRLQLELRERIGIKEHKTEEDLKSEQSIINEMMDIVAKRDALIAVLEADRLRYSHEDKDLEEQMLAKGLMLTPIEKTTPDK